MPRTPNWQALLTNDSKRTHVVIERILSVDAARDRFNDRDERVLVLQQSIDERERVVEERFGGDGTELIWTVAYVHHTRVQGEHLEDVLRVDADAPPRVGRFFVLSIARCARRADAQEQDPMEMTAEQFARVLDFVGRLPRDHDPAGADDAADADEDHDLDDGAGADDAADADEDHELDDGAGADDAADADEDHELDARERQTRRPALKTIMANVVIVVIVGLIVVGIYFAIDVDVKGRVLSLLSKRDASTPLPREKSQELQEPHAPHEREAFVREPREHKLESPLAQVLTQILPFLLGLLGAAVA